ncbi:MAG: TonB-dependent receptor plug domain-containing protein, partial [Longimicrobiales bacterium]
DTPLSATTDEGGRFAMRTVPPGEYDVDVEHLAYTSLADSIVAEFGTNLELLVRMAPDAIPLDPLIVTVRSLMLERNGFYERQERGHGTFITRSDIGRVMPLQSSDVLRTVSGIRLERRRGGFGMIPVGRGNCGFRYFLDGVRVGAGFEIDDIPPEWIEALEIYKGAATVPMEFSPFMREPRANCGLIVIWTKDRV